MLRSHYRIYSLIAVVCLLAGVGLIALPDTARAQEGPVGAAYRGQRTFSQRCTQCHGDGGQGDGPMAAQAPVPIADFTDPAFVETRSPQELFDTITNGRMENLMPPWADALSDQERWDLVAYIWSLHQAPDESAMSAEVYTRACAECHGDDGSGVDHDPPLTPLSNVSSLTQTETDLRQAITGPDHPPIDGLTDADLKLAAAAARNFSLGVAVTSATVEGDGVVDVVVRNGTTGEVVGKQPVRLYLFEGDTFVTDRSAETDAEGRVQFTGLPTDAAWVFLAEVIYEDLTYGGDVRQFESGSTALEIPVNVYEPGASVEDISVGRAHWVLSLESGASLDVGELYSLTNHDDHVYTGEEGDDGVSRVLRFELPPEATNVSVEGGGLGDRFIIEDGALIDTMPMAPGQRQVLFRYSLPVVDGQASLSHGINYPIDTLNLLVPDVGMKIEAPDWEEGESLQTQGGGSFRNFNLVSVPVGANPRAVFSNIDAGMAPQLAAQSSGSGQIVDANATPGISGQPLTPFILVIASVLLIAGGLALVIRRQRLEAAQAPLIRAQQRQSLIQQIADLDDDFEAGAITKADYEAQRRLLKAQLVALTREDI